VRKRKSNKPHLDPNTKATEMLNLGASELAILRQFVREVLETIELDDTGVTDDLYEGALNASEILGLIYIAPDE
jgi:hypothetical protein